MNTKSTSRNERGKHFYTKDALKNLHNLLFSVRKACKSYTFTLKYIYYQSSIFSEYDILHSAILGLFRMPEGVTVHAMLSHETLRKRARSYFERAACIAARGGITWI